MSYIGLLTHRCNKRINTSYASSQNALGEWIYTFSSMASSMRCRMSPITAKERMELQGRFDDITYRLFTESANRVTVDDEIQYNGKTYRIRESLMDSKWHHWSSLLQELS